MSILEIKDNIDNLENKTKEEMIRYVHELLIKDKRNESKIMSLKTEISYMTRHLKKTRDLIDRILKTKTEEENTWKEKK